MCPFLPYVLCSCVLWSTGPQVASNSSRGLPRSLIEGVRAATDPGGDAVSAAVFAQLLLDMHRQVGVMLLDRMGSGEVHKLSKHLEAAAQVGPDCCSLQHAATSQWRGITLFIGLLVPTASSHMHERNLHV